MVVSVLTALLENRRLAGFAQNYAVSVSGAKAVFRELGSVVTVETRWSLEVVFPSRAVFSWPRFRATIRRVNYWNIITDTLDNLNKARL